MASIDERGVASVKQVTVAHVLPLFAFMAMSELAGLVRIENPALPWYRSAPEHWVFPLQCLVIGALLYSFRFWYKLAPWRGLWLASVMGVVGIAIWITPGALYELWAGPGVTPPDWWEWLGIVERRQGFDPTIFGSDTAAYGTTVMLRFVRMVVIVPLVEELFWRGFLMRYVQAGERAFTTVPFGRHSWASFWITTVAVTLVHHPEDYAAAFLWGALVYYVAVKTKSLGACVWMHAVGNLLLGLHVMNTQMWGYW